MFAAVLRKFSDTPRYEEFPDPAPIEGEVEVWVRAAALKPVDRQLAAGLHYAAPRNLPVVCGTDGVGTLSGGTRVFFGGPRAPYGAMAVRTVVPRDFVFPIPEPVNDEVAAALPNPGISAWLSLAYRAKLLPGETVLILGATGTTGKLAVRISKLLGAGRVIAAGRNRDVLGTLHECGADATIGLDVPPHELRAAFARLAGESSIQVVIDYVWGLPAEALFEALTRREFAVSKSEIRFFQVGESAGSSVSLSAAALRSSALSILGTAGIPPMGIMIDAFQRVMDHAARGDLTIETEPVSLTEIDKAWVRHIPGRRLVVIP